MPKVPVLILNGFLGSGKTTLLTNLLVQSHKRQLSIGVVVNDMSKLDVDGLLVAQTEFFEKNDKSYIIIDFNNQIREANEY